ncbi:GNAT family N-acetyltransferase [Erysipelothrix sp. HDW6C]|uniref:GNAT family N-acetyltransferase n=1 Tax=Erysipelothrix sp. HDW6C TaxID=2714930 RepID=UPI00140A3938|nr:GNAT family N-acetyltransferase [Erysipelothrix sp. HDW6C]QIK70753.1 GNAT family N-acetyltransferase [Erysipelothrix sp. HDW6C]
MIRRALEEDFNRLKELDSLLEPEELVFKIQTGRILVYELEGEIIGWLRYNMFWDQIPFMNLLFIQEEYRGRGFGIELMNYWETEMMALGHLMAMTSSRTDEDAQHFYRKFDYQDSGSLVLPGESMEIIFLKNLIR